MCFGRYKHVEVPKDEEGKRKLIGDLEGKKVLVFDLARGTSKGKIKNLSELGIYAVVPFLRDGDVLHSKNLYALHVKN